MDYKKKYEEAQKWVESIYPELSHERQMEAEAFFPELAESEDEKIRKVLIDRFKSLKPNFSWYEVPIDNILAWLEKQKTSEEALQYLKENHSSSELSDFQAAMNIAVAKAYDKGYNDALEKQGDNTNMEQVFRPSLGCCFYTAAQQAIEQQTTGKNVVLAFNGCYIPVKNNTVDELVSIYKAWLKKQGEQNKNKEE